MKKALSMLLAVIMVLTLFAGCGEKPAPTPNEELSAVQQIIKEAEGMTLEELAKKAIEESNGKTFYGVGNSSRGKSALPLFIEYLQSIDSSYTLNFEWQQPKNNKIFEQLTADSLKATGTFAMTLIQDGTRSRARWSRPAFWIPSSPRIGLTPTTPPPMPMKAICPCRPSIRYLCITAPAKSPMITFGTS